MQAAEDGMPIGVDGDHRERQNGGAVGALERRVIGPHARDTQRPTVRRFDGPANGLAGFPVRLVDLFRRDDAALRSEEHTSELQSLMRISYAVFCLKKKKK